MKKIIIITFALALALFSCKDEEATVQPYNITSQINNLPQEALNSDEIESLFIMREEEKLAHDVYTTLYNKWGVNIFQNIAASELKHTNAVLTLLTKYDLADPVDNNVIGVFSNPIIQDLYDQLVSQGNVSTLEAFKVGATIEDLDIFDLNNWMIKVDNEDISLVYANLTKGSRNHMRSFYSQIISSGGTYTAQYLSQAELDAIINSPMETGAW
ncbi:DUF2202 domain-containing protein [Lewinella cohaerens]|uniref:DUF2202 domain-containing protein n=1 Tax=Lewinella cohaerens TaxID=70995 RepID=UPI00035E1B5E|nr:DUF2202 domain-containing protein [Lewinella cohaerens]